MRNRMTITALAALAAPWAAGAVELQRPTVRAWDAYVRAADLQMRSRTLAGAPFLWVEEDASRAAKTLRGEAVVAPVVGRGTLDVTGGLIHHWIGAIFIPGARLSDLLDVVHDYSRFSEIYRPVVTRSRALSSGQPEQEFAMTWQRHMLFVNAAMQTRYLSHDFPLDAKRGYNITESTSIQEIEDYGRAGQRLLPAGTGKGFIWRLHSIARYQERGNGVYLELEVIALTRDVPASLRWLVNPFMNKVSINSLTATLVQTRDAVTAAARRGVAGGVALEAKAAGPKEDQ